MGKRLRSLDSTHALWATRRETVLLDSLPGRGEGIYSKLPSPELLRREPRLKRKVVSAAPHRCAVFCSVVALVSDLSDCVCGLPGAFHYINLLEMGEPHSKSAQKHLLAEVCRRENVISLGGQETLEVWAQQNSNFLSHPSQHTIYRVLNQTPKLDTNLDSNC